MSYKLRGQLYQKIIAMLAEQGVTLRDMAEVVLEGQLKYLPDLTVEKAQFAVEHVLAKREVQNAVITGLELDRLSRERLLTEPLQKITDTDSGTYGVDEVIGTAITSVFGSIAVSNYFYLDKSKPSIIGKLNDKKNNIFIDDIVGAIIGSAEARIAHKYVHNEWE